MAEEGWWAAFRAMDELAPAQRAGRQADRCLEGAIQVLEAAATRVAGANGVGLEARANPEAGVASQVSQEVAAPGARSVAQAHGGAEEEASEATPGWVVVAGFGVSLAPQAGTPAFLP